MIVYNVDFYPLQKINSHSRGGENILALIMHCVSMGYCYLPPAVQFTYVRLISQSVTRPTNKHRRRALNGITHLR